MDKKIVIAVLLIAAVLFVGVSLALNLSIVDLDVNDSQNDSPNVKSNGEIRVVVEEPNFTE